MTNSGSRPSRREFLVAASAVLTASWPTIAFAQTGPVTLDEFMDLSRVLTDDVANLRDNVGAQYQAALDPAALLQLVQATIRAPRPPQTFNDVVRAGVLTNATNAATVQQILTYWYSGLVGNHTADYLGALAWATLGFAVPASTKIGFPNWERRP